MNKKLLSFLWVAITTIAVLPASTYAAPPASSPYATDVTSQSVEDVTSGLMLRMNYFLCQLRAARPDALTNQGPYYALVDDNVCNGIPPSNGPSYQKEVVNSTQVSDAAPMLVDSWQDTGWGFGLMAHTTASSAPSASAPYGVFRSDFCDGGVKPCATNRSMMSGYINANATGLSYSTSYAMAGSTFTSALNMAFTGASSGSGNFSYIFAASGVAPTATTYTFAYNATNFLRSDGVTQACFDRNLANATPIIWSYGLYDAVTGNHYDRNVGFPIQYVDATGATLQGFISYWGLMVPTMTPPASGTTITRMDYSTNPPTQANYTLLQAGGKLIKHTRTAKTLAQMDKVHFGYWPAAPIPAPPATPIMTPTSVINGITYSNEYDLYWDNTLGQFVVDGQYDPMMPMSPVPASAVAVTNPAMAAGNLAGLSFSLLSGDQVSITPADMANLAVTTSATPVSLSTQNFVYPDQFATLGGLKCISDCPTAASILAASGVPNTSANYGYTSSSSVAVPLTGNFIAGSTTATVASNAYVVPGMQLIAASGVIGAVSAVSGTTTLTLAAPALLSASAASATTSGLGTWGPPVPTGSLSSYTLDGTSGNMVDQAGSAVLYAAPMMMGLYSGRMVALTNNNAGDSLTELDAAKARAGTSGQYRQGDTDLIASYYQWDTGSMFIDQLAVLKDATGATVKFDAPLSVNFTVPANNAGTNLPYGAYAGANMTLAYGGFGALWGIPFVCTDETTNGPCSYGTLPAGSAPPQSWVWGPAFAIPYDTVNGYVTADAQAAGVPNATPGQIATYYVKPLAEALRLAYVPTTTICTAALTLPPANATYPTATGFQDPTAIMGPTPTPANGAPRVIQGVVKY